MRYFLLLFLLISTKTTQCPRQQPATKPNIVLIFIDDLGYADLGCFGAKGYATPNLDQMAAEGVRLTNFYAAQPVCSASRAALLTGCYPNRIGIHNALMPDSKIGLNPTETTLADLLKSQGYATGIFGKWHLGSLPEFMPLRQGFDAFFGIPYSNDMWHKHPNPDMKKNWQPLPLYENDSIIAHLEDQASLTTQFTGHAVRFIEKNKDRPFFLYLPHPQPHVPLFVSEKFKGKSERGLFGDVLMELDWSVGEVLKALKNNGLEENTLVIFTSDNGPWLPYGDHAGSAYPLREGKGTVWEGGVREPFIARWKGVLPAGATIAEPVMAIDILPTIAAFTGAPLPLLKIDGKNVAPILTGQPGAKSPHPAYFFYYRTNELQAVRMGKWKMYLPHTYPSLAGQSGGTGGLPAPTQNITLTVNELYDLENDPGETANVIDKHPEVVAEMEKEIERIRLELGDALTKRTGSGVREPGRAK